MRERITPITAYCIRLQRMMYQSQPIAADCIFSRRIAAHCISNAIRCNSLQHTAIGYLSFEGRTGTVHVPFALHSEGKGLIRIHQDAQRTKKRQLQEEARHDSVYIEKLDYVPSSAIFRAWAEPGGRADIGKIREARQAADMPKNKPGAGGKSRAGSV